MASKLLKELLRNHWSVLDVEVESYEVTFRFLVSKFIFTEEQFTEEEKVALFCAFEEMVGKCAIDESFARKNLWWIFSTRVLAQSLNGEISELNRQKFSEEMKQLLSHGRGYFSASMYYGLKKSEGDLFRISIKIRRSKTTKAKSRIAVGYRDKGHLQESHEGAHHWSEVAMALYEHESESTSEKVERLWSNLVVHRKQVLSS